MIKLYCTKLLLLVSLLTWGQRKHDLPRENAAVESEIKSLTTQLKLKNLRDEGDNNFRVWFLNDLAITLTRIDGQESVVVTCYYEKVVNGKKTVSEYKNYVIKKNLVPILWKEFERLNLKEWKNDFEVKGYPSKQTISSIHAYEYTDRDTYRIVKYDSPGLATNTVEGTRASDLKHFLERTLDLDQYRIDFLEHLKQPDKTSRKMLKLLRSL